MTAKVKFSYDCYEKVYLGLKYPSWMEYCVANVIQVDIGGHPPVPNSN